VFGVGNSGEEVGDFGGGEGAVGGLNHGDEDLLDSSQFKILNIDFLWVFYVTNGDKFFD
jgi:hypothetical protein